MMASRLADAGEQAGRQVGRRAVRQLQAGRGWHVAGNAGNCGAGGLLAGRQKQATAEQADAQAMRICSFHRGCFESISISLQKL